MIRNFLVVLLSASFAGFLFRIACALIFSSEHFSALQFKDWMYALVWGARFDFAIAAALALTCMLLSAFLQFLRVGRFGRVVPFFLPLACVCVLGVADLIYYQEAGRHIGYEIRATLDDPAAIFGAAASVYLAELVVGGVIFSSLAIWLGAQFKFAAVRMGGARFALESLSIAMIAVLLIRGGLSDLPLNPQHRFKLGDPLMGDLALNGSYSALYHLAHLNREIKPIEIDLRDIPSAFEALEALAINGGDYVRPTINTNVIVVLLEGWTQERLEFGRKVGGATPHFDALERQGLSVAGMLAGGTRTTEGMFAVFCSFQNPLGQSVANSQLAGGAFGCLPRILAKEGWATAFYQGSHKELAGVGSFAQSIGFAQSYGKEEILKRRYPENNWGVHDDDLYQFVQDHLKDLPQPFFVGINTNSTHDGLLPEGVQPVFRDEVRDHQRLNVLKYADEALGRFIEALGSGEFGPTLIVLVADHTSGPANSKLGQFRVPFAMISTSDDFGSTFVDAMTSHRDIAPTIVEHLGGYVPWFTGRSLLSHGDARFADFYSAGRLFWVQSSALVERDISDSSVMRCFDWRFDPDLKGDHSCDSKAARQSDLGVAFTAYSQRLLFQGKTMDFSNSNSHVNRERFQ